MRNGDPGGMRSETQGNYPNYQSRMLTTSIKEAVSLSRTTYILHAMYQKLVEHGNLESLNIYHSTSLCLHQIAPISYMMLQLNRRESACLVEHGLWLI